MPTDDPGAPDPSPPVAQPSALDIFERVQPVIAVSGMIVTFLLMPHPFAVALIGLTWLVATRGGGGRRFLGFTLTQALAWAATLVIVYLALALLILTLGGPIS